MTKHVSHLPGFFAKAFISFTVAGTIAAISCAGHGQAQSPTTAPAQTAAPEFEAATIKPVKNPNPNRTHDRTEGRRFTAYSVTLRELIMMTYELDAQQITGGPAWVASDEYDVEAVAGEGVDIHEQGRAMMQKLLADRFQLQFHREQRTISVYALTVAKGGSKLTAAKVNDGQNFASCEHFGVCNFRSEPLSHFVKWLANAVLDRPVVDKTGITGTFDFSLKWTPDESQFSTSGLRAPAAGDNATAPPLFTAIEEQLGLKLEPEKMPAEVLVIDKVERPSEN
ncbi:MAG: TIGR03435 family protein [Terracidiphilus sp.]|jgi:uncharacterized protein (TIGR03435 family)